ncbi:MAG TPA: TonB-dependent receptor [Sphingobacteriaceae bacterium]
MIKFFTRVACAVSVCLLIVVNAMAQTTVSGTVIDKATQETLPGVSISVKGRTEGGSTNASGKFAFTTSQSTPFTIVVSYIGYGTVERQITGPTADLRIELEQQGILGQEVVVAASRTPERILESPVSIERVGAAAIQQQAAPSFYDALANLKGVEMSAQSLTFKSVNTRGFNANGNTRFNQYVDGMDNQAPGLNFSVGNIVGVSELDVESVELLPGASSALYGAGGTNGTLLISSKNPFNYQGLSAQYKTGMNHVDDFQRSISSYQDFSARYAKSFNNKVAFKANLSYLTAKDWQAEDYRNYDRLNLTEKGGNRSTDPNFDGVNVYGDEINANMIGVANSVQNQTRAGILAATGNALDIVAAMNAQLPANATPAQIATFIGGLPAALRPAVTNMVPFYFGLRNGLFPNQNVSRTGYNEDLLVDYDTKSLKFSGALHYKLTENLEAIAQANWGSGTSVYTGSDRYSLKDFNLGQYKLELRGADFFLRGYTTQERSGDAYNATALASLMNEASKASTTWFPQYVGTYFGARATGANDAAAHAAARAAADQGRFEPGSPEFEQAKASIISKTIGPGGGARFNDKSNLYNVEGMYNFTKVLNNAADVLVGANYRTYDLNSEGTIFDDLSRDIKINEVGAYAQISKKFLEEKLKLTGSIRYDKMENFDGQFTPRVSGVYTVAPNNNLRVSYQTGYRNPTTQDQYIDLLVRANTRLIGGLPELVNKYNLNTNKGFTQASVAAGAPQQYTFGKFKPESVQAYEIGYKGLLGSNLLIDAYYYFNQYKNFISTLVLLQTPDGSPAGLATGNYQVFSTDVNNPATVETNGFALGADYAMGKYNLNGNVSYNKLTDANSGLITEFNTPEYRFNLGVGNPNFYRNMGFNVQYRWQDDYKWESSFATGTVPAFGTVDAQLSYRVPSIKSMIKVGGSNILNQYYRTSFGNPAMGAIYYVSLTFDQLFK